MDHTSVQGELQAYMDGALAPEQARAVRAHLDGCAACRAELALLREVDETLRAWPVLPEPEGLAARVMGEIRAGSVPARSRATALRRWRALWPWLREHWSEVLLGAAVVATVVVLLVSLRALGARDGTGLHFWELQVQRTLAVVERGWYLVRSGAGRGQWARGSQAQTAAQFYCRVAGAIAGIVALGAGAASVRVLAQLWRQGARKLGRA
jgi:anti-sigma factor RsiW